MRTTLVVLLLLVVLLIGGFLFWVKYGPQVAVSSPSPSPTAALACTLTPQGSVTVYMRPEAEAPVFGSATELDKDITISARTSDGWLGFDPAVAQAPNVGPFRLRWFRPGDGYILSGSCNNLPVAAKLPPLTCFVMADSDGISIRTAPRLTAPIVATMRQGDYIKAIGQTGTGDQKWINTDSGESMLASPASTSFKGWISIRDVNFNGQDCNSLPQTK